MARFFLEIAGQVAAVTCLFESTPHHFAKYLTDRKPDLSMEIRDEDLRFEQLDADIEAHEEGFRRRVFPDPFLERAAIQRKFAEHLLQQDIFLAHGSAVAVDGLGYLFTARSGTGKSTHTRLWREAFGQQAVMINDDKPFLQLTEAGVLIHGSPWSGKHGLDTNICVPLKGICLLERGAVNAIRPATPEQVRGLLTGFRPRTPEQTAAYEALLTKLLDNVPLWHLDCNKETEAARIAHAAMSESYK